MIPEHEDKVGAKTSQGQRFQWEPVVKGIASAPGCAGCAYTPLQAIFQSVLAGSPCGGMSGSAGTIPNIPPGTRRKSTPTSISIYQPASLLLGWDKASALKRLSDHLASAAQKGCVSLYHAGASNPQADRF